MKICQPVRFHRLRGEAGDVLEYSPDMCTARRRLLSPVGSGVAISSEPVLPGETVHLRFTSFSAHDQPTYVRIGFTIVDPGTLRVPCAEAAMFLSSSLPGFRTCRLPSEFEAHILSSALFSIQRSESGAVIVTAGGTVAVGHLGLRAFIEAPQLWFTVEFFGRTAAVELIATETCTESPDVFDDDDAQVVILAFTSGPVYPALQTTKKTASQVKGRGALSQWLVAH